MNPENFEEVGCAVCGELELRKNTSRLKCVKNLLNILEEPGVTRMERKLDTSPIREYKGPVLDYGCSNNCNGCRGDIRRGKVPRLALSNNLWLGAVPNVLKNLTFVEKILVARARHTCAFVKVASGCHIPYLTSNPSSPTPTFWTYLRPLLRRYFNSTSSYPFVAMQPPLLFLSISTSSYCPLLSPVPLLSPIVSIPCYILTCILTCNICALLSLSFIP